MLETYVKILETECTSICINATGEVTAGEIVLSGRLKPAVLQYCSEKAIEFNNKPTEVQGYEDNEDHTFHMNFQLSRKGRVRVRSGANVECLKMAWTKSLFKDVICLVLIGIDDEKMMYQRIGIIRKPRHEGTVDWLEGVEGKTTMIV